MNSQSPGPVRHASTPARRLPAVLARSQGLPETGGRRRTRRGKGLWSAWSPTLSPKVIGVGYAVFVVRMAFVLGIFGTLSPLAWVHGGVLAVTFCAALVVTLGAECLSYSRGTYVPTWMRREAPRV